MGIHIKRWNGHGVGVGVIACLHICSYQTLLLYQNVVVRVICPCGSIALHVCNCKGWFSLTTDMELESQSEEQSDTILASENRCHL